MLLPAINKSANPSSLYSSSHPEGSLNPDRHIFTRHNNVGISRFCYAPSAMQNKIQRPKPSTVLYIRKIHHPSHAHMKKGVNIAEHLEYQRSTLGLLVTTVNPLAPISKSKTRAEERREGHTQVRNACIASTPIVPSSCKMYTPVSTRPSS